jgi:hypothetical protein
MVLLKQLICESFVNLQSPNEKIKFVDVVTDLIYNSYKPVGGFKHIDNKDELRKELVLQSGKPNTYWKLYRKDNTILAVVIYKNTKSGWRSVASGTNQTDVGKKALYKIKSDEVSQKRSFSEVSGKMEHIMLKMGAKKYPFDVAEKILNQTTPHQKLIPDEDGYHYYRIINGKLQRKLLVGSIKNIS